MKHLSILFLLTILIAVACTSSSTNTTPHEQKSTATQVVDKAINWAGGMDRWNALASIDYTKRSKLLLASGEAESDVTQKHTYYMNPSTIINIEWLMGKDSLRIWNNDSSSVKYMNNEVVDQGTKIKESANSALYVLGMPFKLKDDGTRLSYEGKKEFQNKTVDVIKATYSPEEHENHSTSDQWWYYFDETDGAYLGCMVYHPPTYALIENLAFHDVNGLKFLKRRMSYRCDSLGEKQFLRAEFWYDDFSIRMIAENK